MSFLIALVAALVLTPLCALVGSRVGLLDRPSVEALKIHERPIPVTGGLAVVVGALAPVVGDVPIGLVVAVVLALGIGVADDARSLSPVVRTALLALAGTILAASGFVVAPLGPLGGAATVAVVLACANAVNLMDGQDGLTAGLGALAALGLAALLVGEPALDPALGLAGALLGFLAFNRAPARVFLGNGGAYAVGLLLAALAVDAARGWGALLGAGVCLGVFAAELVSTVLRRLRSGRSLVLGDRDHGYDRLAVRLGTRTRSTVVLWAVGAGASAAGWAVGSAPRLLS